MSKQEFQLLIYVKSTKFWTKLLQMKKNDISIVLS